MTKRELALDLPAIRERVADDGEMWLGLSRDEAELLLAEIDRTAAALAAVEQERARLSDRVTRLENAIVFLTPDGGAEVLARIAAAEPSGTEAGQ